MNKPKIASLEHAKMFPDKYAIFRGKAGGWLLYRGERAIEVCDSHEYALKVMDEDTRRYG